MRNTDAAYLAGIVDGEGSLSMTRVGGKKRTGSYWRIVLAVSSCDVELIDWLCQWGGSAIYNMDRGSHRRKQHRWTVVGNDLRQVLPKMRPYLIIKANRADWATRALEIQARVRLPYQRMTTEDRLELDSIRSLFDTDPNRSWSVRRREPQWQGN